VFGDWETGTGRYDHNRNKLGREDLQVEHRVRRDSPRTVPGVKLSGITTALPALDRSRLATPRSEPLPGLENVYATQGTAVASYSPSRNKTATGVVFTSAFSGKTVVHPPHRLGGRGLCARKNGRSGL
jgi:hypothetical protein